MRTFALSYALICLCIRVEADVQFTAVTDRAGIEFRHFTGAMGERYMPETMGAGCAFLDYDADGNLDILLANGTAWELAETTDTPRLYRNTGNGGFVDVTAAAKLNVPMYGMGITIADYDNDTDADIYFTNVRENRLFRNNGDRTFTDVTEFAEWEIRVGQQVLPSSTLTTMGGWIFLFATTLHGHLKRMYRVR